MTTANVTMDTGLGLKHRERAGIVFQPLGTADFQQIVKETEELLRRHRRGHRHQVESSDDEFGYRWLVLEDPDFDDLVVAINTFSTRAPERRLRRPRAGRRVRVRGEGQAALLHLQLQARRVLPVRAGAGRAGPRHGAGAAPPGPARSRAALGGGHGPLVPALGHPAVGTLRSTSGFATAARQFW